MGEFNPPTAVKEGPGNEETMPLDGEAATLDEEGDATEVGEGSDRDEDPGV